jgi:hypothetical protein
MTDVKRCDTCRFHQYWAKSPVGNETTAHKCQLNKPDWPDGTNCSWYEREPGSDDDLGEEN